MDCIHIDKAVAVGGMVHYAHPNESIFIVVCPCLEFEGKRGEVVNIQFRHDEYLLAGVVEIKIVVINATVTFVAYSGPDIIVAGTGIGSDAAPPIGDVLVRIGLEVFAEWHRMQFGCSEGIGLAGAFTARVDEENLILLARPQTSQHSMATIALHCPDIAFRVVVFQRIVGTAVPVDVASGIALFAVAYAHWIGLGAQHEAVDPDAGIVIGAIDPNDQAICRSRIARQLHAEFFDGIGCRVAQWGVGHRDEGADIGGVGPCTDIDADIVLI